MEDEHVYHFSGNASFRWDGRQGVDAEPCGVAEFCFVDLNFTLHQYNHGKRDVHKWDVHM